MSQKKQAGGKPKGGQAMEKKLEVGMRVIIHSEMLTNPVPGVITAHHPRWTYYPWEARPDGMPESKPAIACKTSELEPIDQNVSHK